MTITKIPDAPDTRHAQVVEGYQEQPENIVTIVNAVKRFEERLMRMLDALEEDERFDPRWMAIGRTQAQQAFMAINRAIFQPQRIRLPEDA